MHCLLLNTTTLSNKFAINALWFSKHCTTHIFAKLHIVLFTMNNVHVTFQLITSHMCIWQRLQIQQLLHNSQPGTCDSQGFKNLGGGKWVIIINPQPNKNSNKNNLSYSPSERDTTSTNESPPKLI